MWFNHSGKAATRMDVLQKCTKQSRLSWSFESLSFFLFLFENTKIQKKIKLRHKTTTASTCYWKWLVGSPNCKTNTSKLELKHSRSRTPRCPFFPKSHWRDRFCNHQSSQRENRKTCQRVSPKSGKKQPMEGWLFTNSNSQMGESKQFVWTVILCFAVFCFVSFLASRILFFASTEQFVKSTKHVMSWFWQKNKSLVSKLSCLVACASSLSSVMLAWRPFCFFVLCVLVFCGERNSVFWIARRMTFRHWHCSNNTEKLGSSWRFSKIKLANSFLCKLICVFLVFLFCETKKRENGTVRKDDLWLLLVSIGNPEDPQELPDLLASLSGDIRKGFAGSHERQVHHSDQSESCLWKIWSACLSGVDPTPAKSLQLHLCSLLRMDLPLLTPESWVFGWKTLAWIWKKKMWASLIGSNATKSLERICFLWQVTAMIAHADTVGEGKLSFEDFSCSS